MKPIRFFTQIFVGLFHPSTLPKIKPKEESAPLEETLLNEPQDTEPASGQVDTAALVRLTLKTGVDEVSLLPYPTDTRPTLDISEIVSTSPQEIAALIIERFLDELSIMDRNKLYSKFQRAIDMIQILEAVNNQSFDQIAKSPEIAYSGYQLLKLEPCRDLDELLTFLTSDPILGTTLTRYLTQTKRYKPDIRFPTPENSTDNHEMRDLVENFSRLTKIKKQDIYNFLGIRTLNGSMTTRLAENEYKARLDFLEVSALQGFFRMNTQSSLQGQYNDYNRYRSSKYKDEADSFVSNYGTDYTVNNLSMRANVADFLEKRAKKGQLSQARTYLEHLRILKREFNVEGTERLFENVYEEVRKDEGELFIGGHTTEAKLNLVVARSRNIKLKEVSARIQEGRYKNKNPRLRHPMGTSEIFFIGERPFEIDAIATQNERARDLYFEHKATGHALEIGKQQVIRLVAFANINNATPIIMLDRSLQEIQRNHNHEAKKIQQVLQEIEKEYPIRDGYTQPHLWDKYGHNITKHFINEALEAQILSLTA